MSKTKLILLVILIHTVDCGNVHYITPWYLCPVLGESCITLSTLAANSSDYLDSNTTLVFQEGNHTLDSALVTSNINGSLMLLNNGSGIVAIICNDEASLEFFDIVQLQISGLEFIRCSSKVRFVYQFTLEDSRFHDGSSDSALHLSHTNANIVRSAFVSNTPGTYLSDVGILAYINVNRYRFLSPLPNIQSTSARVGGALIVTDSTVNISSSHFENNTAKVGGAIFSQIGSSITISNSAFVNNSATDCSDDGCHGGALFVENGCTIIAHNSTFMNNTAGHSGGAIALLQGTFLDSAHNVFKGNRAGGSGGAICAYDLSWINIDNNHYCNNGGRAGGVFCTLHNGDIIVTNSLFNNNTSTHGGVMHAYSSSNITVGNSSFYNNTSTHGGVMHAYSSSSITVGNSSFYNNTSSYGGVMHAYSSSSITVGNSIFYNNEASNFGGTMLAQNRSSITVGNSSFDSNKADSGGVINVWYNSNITVGNSSFDNNVAGSYGGVMYAQNYSNIIVDNCSFDNNEAGTDGGVMSVAFSSRITVDNSFFQSNRAIDDGGVMHAYSRSSIAVGNSSFDHNEAKDNGGVLYALTNSSITVENSSFDDNDAGRHGGVLYAEDYSNITEDNCSFDNNEAAVDGGVVSVALSSRITAGNSFFQSNRAIDDGGVMLAYRSSITVGNSSFDNNKAKDNGGVMFVFSDSSITVGNSSFDNNDAGARGGVMHLEDHSSITVDNSFFNNNVAHTFAGVLLAHLSSSITVGNSFFGNNEAGENGGAMWVTTRSTINVDSSFFDCNVARYGGTMFGHSSRITVGNSSFSSNAADFHGGVLYAYFNTIVVLKSNCIIFNNSAQKGGVVYIDTSYLKDMGSMYFDNVAIDGGVFFLSNGDLNIMISSFVNNTATNTGGVLYVPDSVAQDYITLAGSAFHSNQATHSGGVIALQANDYLSMTQSTFSYNSANRGGVIFLQTQNNLTIRYSNFSYNSASSDGGVIYSADQNILTVDNGTFNFNRADNYGGVLCLLFQTKLTVIGDYCIFIGCVANSGGAVFAMESRLVFSNGNSKLVENVATSGGAIFATDSQLAFINSSCDLVGNQADCGGAIYASDSKLVVDTEVNRWTKFNVSANLAMHHGGGLYMIMSDINTKGHTSYITKNQANNNGGGIYASSSSIIIEGEVHLISNEADNGGAISLERYTKLQGTSDKNDSINLISNRANHYGGALYVDDKTNPEMCAAVTAQNNADSESECFFNSVFLSFTNNSAGTSGINLFGGLLDRCTESYQMKKVGLASFQNSSNINVSQLDTISSHPVQLCFCRGGQPDCNYHPEPISVNRGKAFSLQLIAYNHISMPIRADVDIDSLGSGRIINKNIDSACTEVVVQFNLFTPVDYENLTVSIVGPCNVPGVSVKNLIVKFTCNCPIGFQILSDNETSCDCVCDQVLQLYEKTECNLTTKSIIRRENFWISYINHTWSNSSGYVIYPHCPYDYCYTADKQVSVNLNLPNGSDAQCDLNRMGILCGTCRLGLSVSLGSSKCVTCPAYWPGLHVTITIVFIISGVGLVAFLLVLNLTVAIGTLNAIIFYANVVAANKSAVFPSGVSPASVFISWLNFDLGFDVCFFNGLDTYAKTWLQLAFPAYIIILVVVIIQLSSFSSTFGRLIGKKDPVATLATLILLSYTKLLQTIITAFFLATLAYPDGSKKTLWLPDATLEYFSSKHAVLFFVAILILLAGLVYTFLLFSRQWFIKFPHNRVTWIRNQKLSSFIDIYLNPYTLNHRYWTGLLLLVRVSVYLVSAFNPSGDPRVTLSATNFIMTSLIIYIATFGVRMYKNHFINAMETLTYFNIMALSTFTWYTIDANTNQTAITNISVVITFIQLIAVILYHTYKHMNQKLFSTIQESLICIKMKEIVSQRQQERTNDKLVSADENILLDMINRPTNTDYNYNITQAQSRNPYEPTQSIVELPQSQQQPPPALEATKKEPELECEQQVSVEQDGVYVIKNQSLTTNTNEQCVDNNMVQSSHVVHPFPADIELQEEGGCHCITVEAKIHDC